jgi:FKBP-type peptidyl-prolyl cis-trans isomerase FklB
MESYSLGYEFGENLRSQEVEVDMDVLASAIRDGLDGKEPGLSRAVIGDTLTSLRRKVVILQDRRFREMAAGNAEEGDAFLAGNKTREGVHTLPDGLQYKISWDGTGPVPQPDDLVKVSYVGTLVDGTEFDNSHRRGGPAIVSVNGVIRGWTEALQLMKVGSKWRIFVPLGLAYGERRFGRIPPSSTLIFDIELLSIERSAGPDVASSKDAVEPWEETK